ncbi:MAG: hypothetical protein LUE27_04130 [Clostridia bacterium]|nr:hypothetical protein [Clostridia bacterium]
MILFEQGKYGEVVLSKAPDIAISEEIIARGAIRAEMRDEARRGGSDEVNLCLTNPTCAVIVRMI